MFQNIQGFLELSCLSFLFFGWRLSNPKSTSLSAEPEVDFFRENNARQNSCHV